MTTEKPLETTAGPTPASDRYGDASPALLFTVGSVVFTVFSDGVGIGARNMDAMIKSRAILARGLCALGKASIGISVMSVEQSWSAAKEISKTKSAADWIAAQRCLAKLGVDRMVGTSRMLSNMALQVVDDATVPLTRRMRANLKEIATASVA